MAVLQMWAAMGEPKLQANAWPRPEASGIPSPGVSVALWSSSEPQQPPQKGSVFSDEVKDVGLVTTMKITAALKQGRVGGTHYRLSTLHLQTQTLKCFKVQNSVEYQYSGPSGKIPHLTSVGHSRNARTHRGENICLNGCGRLHVERLT